MAVAVHSPDRAVARTTMAGSYVDEVNPPEALGEPTLRGRMIGSTCFH
jgi:hypothetical protein